jgi:Txe/YoeB family toxin of Txe-Axe toxin-antitoxin module
VPIPHIIQTQNAKLGEKIPEFMEEAANNPFAMTDVNLKFNKPGN